VLLGGGHCGRGSGEGKAGRAGLMCLIYLYEDRTLEHVKIISSGGGDDDPRYNVSMHGNSTVKPPAQLLYPNKNVLTHMCTSVYMVLLNLISFQWPFRILRNEYQSSYFGTYKQ
jgi:hypothetical protein